MSGVTRENQDGYHLPKACTNTRASFLTGVESCQPSRNWWNVQDGLGCRPASQPASQSPNQPPRQTDRQTDWQTLLRQTGKMVTDVCWIILLILDVVWMVFFFFSAEEEDTLAPSTQTVSKIGICRKRTAWSPICRKRTAWSPAIRRCRHWISWRCNYLTDIAYIAYKANMTDLKQYSASSVELFFYINFESM